MSNRGRRWQLLSEILVILFQRRLGTSRARRCASLSTGSNYLFKNSFIVWTLLFVHLSSLIGTRESKREWLIRRTHSSFWENFSQISPCAGKESDGFFTVVLYLNFLRDRLTGLAAPSSMSPRLFNALRTGRHGQLLSFMHSLGLQMRRFSNGLSCS